MPLLKRTNVTTVTVRVLGMVGTVCEGRAINAVLRAFKAAATHTQWPVRASASRPVNLPLIFFFNHVTERVFLVECSQQGILIKKSGHVNYGTCF